MIHQNDSLWRRSLFHRLLVFFPPKTGGRLKIFLSCFPAKVAGGEPHLWVVYLWVFGQVHPIPFQWNLCRWRTCCSFLVVMYHLQSLLVCFGSLSGMSTNPWPICRVLEGIAWRCSMLWSLVWLNFLFTYCKSPTLQLAKAAYGCSSFTTLRCIETFLCVPKISKDSSVKRTLFHCSIVQFLFALSPKSLLSLFFFLNNGFLTTILTYRLSSLSLPLSVNVDIFSRHWFCLGQ